MLLLNCRVFEQTPFLVYVLAKFITVNNLGFITNSLDVLEVNISPISTYKIFTLW